MTTIDILFLPISLQPSLPVLYTLSSQATHEAVHLLCRMLVFDPVSIFILPFKYSIVLNVAVLLNGLKIMDKGLF